MLKKKQACVSRTGMERRSEGRAQQRVAENLELFQCTRQPGRLKISARACGLRYLLAQEARPKSPFYDDFSFSLGTGLEICRTCPEGLQNAGVASRRPFEPVGEGRPLFPGKKKKSASGLAAPPCSEAL